MRNLIGVDFMADVVEATAPVGPNEISQSAEQWRKLPRLTTVLFVNTSVMSESDPIVPELKRTRPEVEIVIAWSDAHIAP